MRIKILFLTFLLVLCPVLAWAELPGYLKEFTTYGHFDIIATAFQRLALIMSDTSYEMIYFALIVLTIVFTGLKTVGISLFTGKVTTATWVQWMATAFVGMTLYAAFLKPTTDMVVFDETNNQQIVINGVPEGVALIANLANVIETGMVDIIETAATPDGFKDNPGGIGFNIIRKVFENQVPIDSYLKSSLRAYIKDCIYFELSNPDTKLDLNTLNATTDFMPIFAEAMNPAVWTVYYDDANKAGVSMTCSDAWGNIQAELTTITEASSLNTDYWEKVCADAGLSDDDVAGKTGPDIAFECRLKAVALTNQVLGTNITSSQLVRQKLLGDILYQTTLEEGGDAAVRLKGGHDRGNALIASGLIANEWMPHLRTMLFVANLGIMPLMLVFLCTPIYRQVASFVVGTFVFFVCWGVADAVLHQVATDQALNIMEKLESGDLGYRNLILFEGEAMKAYATYGPYKMVAFMMATVFSGVFVRMGGAQLGRIGMMETGKMATVGNVAATQAVGPGSRQHFLNAMVDAEVGEEKHAEFGMQPQVTLANLGIHRSMVQAQRTIDMAGGPAGQAKVAGQFMGNVDYETQTMRTVGLHAGLQSIGDAGDVSSQNAYETAVRGSAQTMAIRRLAEDNGTTTFGIYSTNADVAAAKQYGQNTGALDAASGNLKYMQAQEHQIGYVSFLERGTENLAKMDNLNATLGAKELQVQRQQSQYLISKGLSEIMQTGQMSDETRDSIGRFIENGTSKTIFEMEASNVRVGVANEQAAQNLSNYFGVSNSNLLAGKTAQFALGVRDDGSLQSLDMSARGGVQISERDIAERHIAGPAGETRAAIDTDTGQTVFSKTDAGWRNTLAAVEERSGVFQDIYRNAENSMFVGKLGQALAQGKQAFENELLLSSTAWSKEAESFMQHEGIDNARTMGRLANYVRYGSPTLFESIGGVRVGADGQLEFSRESKENTKTNLLTAAYATIAIKAGERAQEIYQEAGGTISKQEAFRQAFAIEHNNFTRNLFDEHMGKTEKDFGGDKLMPDFSAMKSKLSSMKWNGSDPNVNRRVAMPLERDNKLNTDTIGQDVPEGMEQRMQTNRKIVRSAITAMGDMW